MRNLYEPLSRKRRAEQMRKDAQECDNAGYPVLARVNWEMAGFLDPYIDPEDLDKENNP